MLHKIYENNPSTEGIERVVRWIEEGKVIIFPTGIGYAFGCSALKQKAIEEVCHFKGIDPRKNTLAVMCKDIAQATRYACVNDEVFSLLKKRVYEPATYILPTKGIFPGIIKNRKEVGIRICSHPLTQYFLEKLEAPLLTGSLPMVMDIEEDDRGYYVHPELIDERFGFMVEAVIDGGIAPGGYSAIIDCRGEEPVVVRPYELWH